MGSKEEGLRLKSGKGEGLSNSEAFRKVQGSGIIDRQIYFCNTLSSQIHNQTFRKWSC